MEKIYFQPQEIDDTIFKRMRGLSYKDDCTLSLEELRYIRVLHYDFQGNVQEGELVVNRRIARDTAEVFRELYEVKYPIEKIRLIDAYDADDERSMADNNSSAFNYRTIADTNLLSNHALGMAIDINPLYNPYVRFREDGISVLPENAWEYADRDREHPYYIRKDDICYRIFTSHGFTWGGEWTESKDYQHFERRLESGNVLNPKDGTY